MVRYHFVTQSRQITRLGLLLCLLSIGFTTAHSPTVQAQDPAATRNVILIIGDGMDEHQITIARNYLHGAEGKLGLDRLPLRAAVQVLTKEDKVDGKPVYVSDSANTATSMATGVVTSRGRIATSAGSDKNLTTIAELAAAAGYRTGIVTTASVTDATASAFAAHINYRLCENPGMMVDVTISDIVLGDCSSDLQANGGKGSIAEQLASSTLHVALGGGAKHFDVAAEGSTETVAAMAQKQGFTVARTAQQMEDAPQSKRLLGIFAPSTLPVRLQGENGRTAEKPEPSLLNSVHRYLGSVEQPAIMSCEPNPDFAQVPSLVSMTDTAIAHLSADNEKGFFLMIESASIDKQAHERKPCGSIGELEQLDEALASALKFASKAPNTLILITADHAQAAQLIPFDSLFAAYPIPVFSPGSVARIKTPEGSHMAVNYATTNFMMEEHTGAAVPLFGNAQSVGRVPAYLTQPEIFDIMRDYLNL